MARLILISHPEVVVDPARPIPDWGLSDLGHARATAFASSPALAAVSAIWSSSERKARETAELLAAPRGLAVRVDPRLGENDRSATGFLPPDVFEIAADAFFAHPQESHRGWERAVDAQARIHGAYVDIRSAHRGSGDLAIVSHGAVGTLLYCRLAACPIHRRHDQPSQGHYWTADLATGQPDGGWRPIT